MLRAPVRPSRRKWDRTEPQQATATRHHQRPAPGELLESLGGRLRRQRCMVIDVDPVASRQVHDLLAGDLVGDRAEEQLVGERPHDRVPGVAVAVAHLATDCHTIAIRRP